MDQEKEECFTDVKGDNKDTISAKKTPIPNHIYSRASVTHKCTTEKLQ